jgi:hypothetical protein
MLISNSNKKFLKELRQYNFLTTWINPHETKHVLISFNADYDLPIRFFITDTTNNVENSSKIFNELNK